MLIYEYGVENPCTISLYDFNIAYHFLGRRQNACYVNYSKLAVEIPSLFLQFLIGLQFIPPLQHTQQLNLNTLILLANLLSILCVFPRILLALLVFSLPLSITIFLFLYHFSHAVSF
jgi:hypothetical protein